MPSFRVNAPTVPLHKYDVIGKDGTQPGFIRHAGLAESANPGAPANAVAVIDMGPPLRGPEPPGHMMAHAVGRADLTDDEVQKIRTFVDQHAAEHETFQLLTSSQVLRLADRMYCIYPHAVPAEEEDGRYARTRFSCSGFVLEAYRFARIQLVDPDVLPGINMPIVTEAYSEEVRLMERAKISLESLGLKGAGPWPVLLCGYLLHALDRAPEAIRKAPYTPTTDDRFFTQGTSTQ